MERRGVCGGSNTYKIAAPADVRQGRADADYAVPAHDVSLVTDSSRLLRFASSQHHFFLGAMNRFPYAALGISAGTFNSFRSLSSSACNSFTVFA